MFKLNDYVRQFTISLTVTLRLGIHNPVDQLNFYTASLLGLMTVIFSTKTHFGHPIQCLTPAEWPDGWDEYAEDLCFINGTYVVDKYARIPFEYATRKAGQIQYYQWVSIVLFFQSFAFIVPYSLWLLLSWQSGINMIHIVEKAREINRTQGETRNRVRTLLRYINASLRTTNTKEVAHSIGCMWKGGCGSYAICAYLFVKLLCIACALGQFYMINWMLTREADVDCWAVQVWNQIRAGNIWAEMASFPRVTYCDVVIIRLGQPVMVALQCVIMINMWYEKLYTFLWLWLPFVGIVNCVDFLMRLYMFVTCVRRETLRRYIRRGRKHSLFYDTHIILDKKKDEDEKPAEGVIEGEPAPVAPAIQIDYIIPPKQLNYVVRVVELNNVHIDAFHTYGLTNDGLLLMYFIELHAGDVMASRLVYKMFKKFINDDINDDDDAAIIAELKQLDARERDTLHEGPNVYTKRGVFRARKLLAANLDSEQAKVTAQTSCAGSPMEMA